MKHTKFYQKGYPRPQFVRNNYINLNGEWEFAFDDQNIGEKEEWFNTFPNQQTINVPFTYQTPASGINDQTHHPVVWYNRTIDITKEQLNDKRLLLHFEGSDYYTKLYVNGKFVNDHKGGYTRFSFDITDFIHEGKNTITVRVEDDYSTTKPRGKQRWHDQSYECWYVDTTGIWKTVWCEFVPEYYLQHVKMTPNVEDYTLDVEYTFNAITEGLAIETIITYEDFEVAKVTIEPKRTFFKNKIDLVSEAHHFKVHLWSFHNPKLYDIEFKLYKDGKLIDSVGSYFGVRHISTDNSSFNINYVPSYLKMVLDQGYWTESHLTPPSEEAILLDLQRTLEMGYNGIRKHEKIEDELFTYYCDILGLYVWIEMPSTYEFNDEAIVQFTTEWMDIVKQYHNHPSVITWVPFNESWGIQNIKINRKQQQFTESIYHLTKAFDQTRPVVTNDGWEHTISDIITLHNYQEMGENLIDCYGDIESFLKHQKTKGLPPRHPFADNYSYKGQPIMITEYAGIAFEQNKDEGWGYGKLVKNEEDFLNRLRSLTKAIYDLDFCSGYCVTQLTDVQQEVNGLLKEDRKPKVSIEAIKDINENIG